MSTRANIVLEQMGDHIWIYHHSDGYPSYLGDFLMRFMATKHRADYSDIYDIANELFKNKDDDGFKLTHRRHGDIEYLYIINIENKTIKCFSTGFATEYEDKQLIAAQYNNDDEINKWFCFCDKAS